MQIATWNVNGIRARLEYVLDWLKERQPDIVGLQELKAEEGNFPFETFAEAGYYAVIHGQKAWNGVAVLSREQAEVKQSGLPGQEELGARLITATVSGLDFISVYCPNGKSVEHPDFQRKLGWFESLVRYLETNFSPWTTGAWLLSAITTSVPPGLTAGMKSSSGEAFSTQMRKEAASRP